MLVKELINFLVVVSTDYLITTMLVIFTFSVIARVLIWWTIKRELWFSLEFDKRIQRYMSSTDRVENLSFFSISKRLLEITYYEVFEVRSIMKRRNPDVVMDWMDRLFLIQQGSARAINDILRKIRFMKFDNETPDFSGLSKSVLQKNPCFTRLFGIVPITGLNDLLNIIPNLFIVGGIFGTFLGVMDALPELGGMDLENSANSKLIMDTFLLKISFSMSTSIAGIVLSVMMTILNTFFSADKVSLTSIDSLSESMGTLWAISDHNLQDGIEPHFDGDKDPLLVLAEDSIAQELNVQPGFVKLSRPIQGWWLKKSENKEDPQEKNIKEQTNEPKNNSTENIDRRTAVLKETNIENHNPHKSEESKDGALKTTNTEKNQENVDAQASDEENETAESVA